MAAYCVSVPRLLYCPLSQSATGKPAPLWHRASQDPLKHNTSRQVNVVTKQGVNLLGPPRLYEHFLCIHKLSSLLCMCFDPSLSLLWCLCVMPQVSEWFTVWECRFFQGADWFQSPSLRLKRQASPSCGFALSLLAARELAKIFLWETYFKWTFKQPQILCCWWFLGAVKRRVSVFMSRQGFPQAWS